MSWDVARELANNKNYREAILQYKNVLALKPNIEEVKWELCKALIEVGEYRECSLILENLLEIDNKRVIYLVTAGRVAMLLGNPQQATTFFGQAMEVAPDGDLAIEAQRGFVEGLLAQGRIASALPLMEQLLVKDAPSAELLRNTAKYALEIGEVEKSVSYYRQLIEKFRVAPETLIEAATAYEKIDKIEEAAKLWEKYLEIYPSSIGPLVKAAEHYLKIRDYDKAASSYCQIN